jgi:hypothetical protein
VARRVGDDELAPLSREVAVCDVDRDALFALGREAVQDEREVELSVAGSELARVRLERRQLIAVQLLGLEQEPADQGALAVVDRPAEQEPEQFTRVFGAKLAERLAGCPAVRGALDQLRVRAQKYPSCFLTSIDPAAS